MDILKNFKEKMTAPYKYKYEPWTKICSSEDWTISALDFLGGRAGITGEFKYSTLGIHILTGIISKVSGMTTVDFANQYLFESVGIKPHQNYYAEDAAKIGQLCLDKGNYKGKQIVSSKWIEEMKTPFIRCGEKFRNMSYGYLWWLIDEKSDCYSAIGNSGNVIYVNPSNNITIAVTSYFKPTIFDRIDFIQKYIEPILIK